MNRNLSSVPALARGLDILQWVVLASDAVTLTQIAQGTGLKVSEVQRPVGCLLQRGYLTRTAAGAYVISGKLFRLAATHPPFQQILRVAQPLMAEFAQEIGQTVHLCVPDGDAAMVIADAPGGGLVRISLQVGARLNAESTVSGRLLWAAGVLEKPNKPVEALAKRLLKIAEQGFERAQSEHAEGIVDTGVVIRGADGIVVAALTTSELRLLVNQVKKGDLLTALRSKAELIGAGL
jgi:DNA-binding IclR family transcriptional regulator